MSTNSLPLRALIPNPTAEKGELLAAVTNDGKLMIANLREQNFITGGNGQILKDGVSCISWSSKGKQLVAGLGDGTAFQMTPDGVGKAEIPRPPNVDPNYHVSSITWLENNVFLMVHTPSNFDPRTAPQSVYHLVTRNQNTNEHIFQKLTEPVAPFGLNRSPPHHFIVRLRDFPPNLQDLLIVASTASVDIGLFSRSKVPLTSNKPAEKITGVFTMTEMSDDSRRAQMPMSEDMNDSSPIGVTLDLSSKDKVLKPIPSDEMDESPSPLPSLMVLNNEGILASWWIIYGDSVRQGTVYPGLVAAEGAPQSMQTSTSSPSAFGGAPNKPAFGQSTFGAPSNPAPAFAGFSKPAAPAFGGSSPMGSSSSGFGAPSALSKAPSVWGTPGGSATNGAPAFGTPAFGSSSASTQNLAFGSSALPGSRPSPWAAAGSKTPSSTFGKPSGLGAESGPSFGAPSGGAAFGSASNLSQTSGGFAAFANQGGFASVASNKGTTNSIFGSKTDQPTILGASFGSAMDTGSTFGGISNTNEPKPGALFGSSDFTLGSTFKPDGSAKDDTPKPASGAGGSFFGSGFGSTLNETQKPVEVASPEADMDADEPETEPQLPPRLIELIPRAENLAPVEPVSTTPASTPAAPKFQLPVAPSSLFGSPTAQETPSSTAAANNTATFSFGTPALDIDLSKETTASKPSLQSEVPMTPEAPKIKQEPESEESRKSALDLIPEAPLPPDTVSKSTYTVGDTSGSSVETDAPLPPDFGVPLSLKPSEEFPVPPLQAAKDPGFSADLLPPSDVPGGPEEEIDDSDYVTEDEDVQSNIPSEEESGEDVAKDLSPTSELQQTPGFTPQSSFGGKLDSAGDNMFTKISRPAPDQSTRSLFGEINGRPGPVLPPPKVLASPRSPSPIRRAVPGRLLRPDTSRSVSAPGIASQLLGARSTPHTVKVDTFALTMEQKKVEEQQRVEALAKKEAEETQTLIDEEDERLQNFLEGEIQPTKKLDDFVAHHDYVGNAEKDSIPAQVEAVYRDINSMIDTLGLNSHSMKCFIKGHTELYKDPSRTREDLETDDEWCLTEIDNLSSIIEKDLAKELENGRVTDIEWKLQVLADLDKDLKKLRARQKDLSDIVAAIHDPERLEFVRSHPLTAEQSAQQHDLRRDFGKFQKLLGEAEEALILLRAKLSSQNSGRNKDVPTVEAVMKTIKKMTSMAEKRSGDIDFLEDQMRRLRMSSVVSNESQEGSPFATSAKQSIRAAGASNTHGLSHSPESVRSTPQRFLTSLTSSAHSYSRATPPRKKLGGFTDDDKSRLRAKTAQRKSVTEKLRGALQKSQTRVRGMNEN